MEIRKNDFLGFLGAKGDEVSKKTEEKLNEYERMMESEQLLYDIRFSQSEHKEGLRKQEGDIELFLPKEEVSYRFSKGALNRESMNRYYTVQIIDVDRDKKRVTVSHVRAQEKVKPIVIQQIEETLEKGREFRTKARVVLFARESRIAFLDILGLGIQGMVHIEDWSVSYVKSLSSVVNIGDIVDIAITKHSAKYTENEPQYVCSRKIIMEENNPWKTVEERIPKHSNVLIRCIEKYTNNFLGKIDGIEELTVYCFYPDKAVNKSGQKVVIQKGGIYNGYICAVNGENQILRARIVGEADVMNVEE